MPIASVHLYANNPENLDGKDIYISYAEMQTYKDGLPSGYGPLQENYFKKIFANVINENDNVLCDGFLKYKLLYINWQPLNRKIAFVMPSAKKTIKFSGKKMSFIHPDLLFLVSEAEVSVFALDNPNPDENSKLYYAPFPNVYDSGGICVGTYEFNEGSSSNDIMDEIDYWFFESEFNHWHHQKYNENILSLHGKESWKKEELIPFKKGIKQVILGK